MKLPNKLDHAIAVINLYFSLKPAYWQYEPKETFRHQDQDCMWSPDCIFVYQKKVYVCEVQLTPLSQKRWAAKWSHFNHYFNGGHFREAAFQRWSDKTILPQFLVITSQMPETVRNGFSVDGRELIVSKNI